MPEAACPTCPIVFETELGFFGLEVSERGVARVTLPLPTREEAAAAIGGRPSTARGEAGRVVALLRRWARGEAVRFDDVRLDLEARTPFERAVFEAARRIPHGETRTYGELAKAIGKPGAARAVGAALGRNPVPPIVPCHRIVARGSLGGFSAPGGLTTKERLLSLERPA